jgi:hypothetical protein
VHEQAHAEHARSCLEWFLERDEHRDRLARACDHDALASVYALEQLRQRAASVIRVVLSKRII